MTPELQTTAGPVAGPADGPGPDSGPGSGPGVGRGPARLRAEAARVRTVGDRLGLALWVVAGIALLFTMVNVTLFAVDHGVPWPIAWLLDPMASLALLVVLVGDGVLARHGVRSGGWSHAVKFGAGAATWSMNVWASVVDRDGAGIVLHSVAPALVIGLAEVTPLYRARFAALADRLEQQADDLQSRAAPPTAQPMAQPAGQPAATVTASGVTVRTAAADPDVRPVPEPGLEPEPGPGSGPSGPDSGGRARRSPAGAAGPDPARVHSTVRPTVHSTVRPTVRSVGRSDRSVVRRTEAELEQLVRAAITAGELSAAPSGTAIQRRFGGGKTPAVRVAARLTQDVLVEGRDGRDVPGDVPADVPDVPRDVRDVRAGVVRLVPAARDLTEVS